MQKIGEYWVPDVDTRWWRARRKTLANFEGGGQGQQLHHLTGAVEAMRGVRGDAALAAGTAIDAGANVGSYARHMAGVFAHVHAFEPAPDTYECLARNVADWGLSERITAHPNALSSHAEGVSMGAGLGRRSVSREVRGPGDIPAIPLDSLGLAGVVFLKLDVEGYEEKVLGGALRLIEDQRPFVMMEAKDRKFDKPGSTRNAHEFLTARGYSVIRTMGDPVVDRLYAPQG